MYCVHVTFPCLLTMSRSSGGIHVEEENSETEVDPHEEQSDLTTAASKDAGGSRGRKGRRKSRKKRKGNKPSKKS